MKPLVLVAAACLPMLAGERDPGPATPQAVCHDSANPRAKKTRKGHSPIYYLRRAGQAEVGLAIRLSSWGIHDPDANQWQWSRPSACDFHDSVTIAVR